MLTLLVIDDEPNICFSIEEVFADHPIRVFGAETAEEGLRMAREVSPDVILLNIKLGSRSGLEVFEDLRKIDPKSLVVFITGHGTADTAIEAMKIGAYDYLTKPLDVNQLYQVIDQALNISRLMHVPAIIEEGDRPQDRPDLLVGCSSDMQVVFKQIGRIAPQDVNVLILGESGTGKELVARAIYHHSQRSQAPFLAINCAAIPESLLESELFGHERGAFTGAERRRIGKFEQCHGGTLFLDEVGDMPPNTQAKMLRLLQEGCFERVGGSETITVDVRVIAATNQDLESLIEEGGFRKDLYYRLRGVTMQLPPLRERREDISELAHYFLFRFNRKMGTEVQSISPTALKMLHDYDWAGNIRELQNAIRESLIVSAGPTILPEFLPAEIRAQQAGDHRPSESESQSGHSRSLSGLIDYWISNEETNIYRRALEHFDRLLITRTLRATGGNQLRTAEVLGLSRVTLRAKIRSLQLDVETVVGSEE